MPGETVVDLDRAEQYAEMLGSGVKASAKPDATSQCYSYGFVFMFCFPRQLPVTPSDAGHEWSVIAVLRRTQANDRKWSMLKGTATAFLEDSVWLWISRSRQT